jgi:cytokinin dehydrogenase
MLHNPGGLCKVCGPIRDPSSRALPPAVFAVPRSTAAAALLPGSLAELARHGRVWAPAPRAFRRDYGNLASVTPRAVVRPDGVEGVEAVVRWAAERGMRVVPRGHGCSSGGQSLTRSVSLDTSALDALGEPSGGTVWAGAGCRWGAVQEALVARGLALPVVVNNALATVGGTLSVGGFGAMSLRRGPVVSHVRRLEVVTGTGERVRACADVHPELFRHALAGLGKVGVIAAAELAVVPHRPFTSIIHRWFPHDVPLDEIAAAAVADPACDVGLVLYLIRERKWKLVLGWAHAERPERPEPGAVVVHQHFRDVFTREAAFVPELEAAHVREGRMRRAGQARRLWSDFLVPAAAAPTMFATLAALFGDPRTLWGFYGTVLHRAVWAAAPPPLAPVPGAETSVTMGPYCVVSPAEVEAYRNRFDQAAEVCLGLGGRVYLYGQLPRLPDFVERQYGSAGAAAWRAACRTYDPAGVLGTTALEAE